MSKKPFPRRILLLGLALLAPIMTASAAPPTPGASPTGDAKPKTILFFGDSLTAGYGLDDPSTQSYPALIGEKLKDSVPRWKIVNAGLSGETTSAGLRRIDWVLRQPVDIFVLALGGNDGLRGIAAPVTRSNLEAIVKKVRTKNPNATIVLAGMKMPVSMGTYATDFEGVFYSLAKADKTLINLPFLLEGVGGVAALNQGDAIHPNVEGHKKIAEHVWKTIQPLVGK